jgi:hypothetical protein
MVMATKYNSVQGKLRKGGGKGMSGDALVGKVSQSTINDIKKMGMTKALALAGKNGKTSGGMAREFQEGVRRMYGAKRLEAAKSKYAPVAKSADAARAGAMAKKPASVTYKSADAARSAATKPKATPAGKPAAKNNTKSNLIKGTLGAAAAVGVLAASKGKGAGVAAKLSPAVGKLASSKVGKAVFGSGEKLTSTAFSTSGKIAAKAGKPVSQTQYDAMKAAAKAKGIKPPKTGKVGR